MATAAKHVISSKVDYKTMPTICLIANNTYVTWAGGRVGVGNWRRKNNKQEREIERKSLKTCHSLMLFGFYTDSIPTQKVTQFFPSMIDNMLPMIAYFTSYNR